MKPLTQMFCNVACANKRCHMSPTPDRLKEAKVVRMENLQHYRCGYKPIQLGVKK